MKADEILKRLLDALPDTYQKTIGFPSYDLLASVALRLANTDEVVEENIKKLDPENLTGDDLDRYIFPRIGMERKEATFATGVLTITGNGTVNAGDLFESAGGIQFSAMETVEIKESGLVSVVCVRDGDIGNIPAHSITQMPVTLQGINTCDNFEKTTGGYDEETDAAYFERFLIKVRTPPTSGNIYHYMSWALEVAGVGHVKVFPFGHGKNTVDVVLVDSTGKPADAELVLRVQDYIDPGSTGEGYGEAPIGAMCFVSAADEKIIDISVNILKETSAGQEVTTKAINESIEGYLSEIAFSQDHISYAKVGAAILDAEGVSDYEELLINETVKNIPVGERECAVLGEVRINYV